MSNILIIVEGKRLGLQKECRVLTNRLISVGFHVLLRRSSEVSFRDLVMAELVVVYSLSIRHIIFCFISMIIGGFGGRRIPILWVNHEPNGFLHKLQNNSLLYAVCTRVAELAMTVMASSVGTPNSIAAHKYGFEYLPLQYNPPKFRPLDKTSFKPGYMGRLDATRRLSANESVLYFPGTFGTSESAKEKFANSVTLIINIYDRRHAQSGVTPDGLSLGLPVVVSSYDAWCEHDWGGYLVTISEEEARSLSDKQLLNAIQKKFAARILDWHQFQKTFDFHFGMGSFDFWVKALGRLL